MKTKHTNTLQKIFNRPISANIKWSEIESLLISLGADVQECAGSRIRIKLFGEIQVYHRPHPRPTTDKAAVESVRRWLEQNGVKP